MAVEKDDPEQMHGDGLALWGWPEIRRLGN